MDTEQNVNGTRIIKPRVQKRKHVMIGETLGVGSCYSVGVA